MEIIWLLPKYLNRLLIFDFNFKDSQWNQYLYNSLTSAQVLQHSFSGVSAP